MSADNQKMTLRMVMLIATAKCAASATELYKKSAVPVQYQFHANGTASNEMMDLLGLGNVDRTVIVSLLPKTIADETLRRLKVELKLDAANSGIAFSVPVTGSNSMLLEILSLAFEGREPMQGRKESGQEMKYSMIAAIVGQGFSEDVMVAARSAGASGGTVLHSHRIANEDTENYWGLGAQMERDIVMILTDTEKKMPIMQAISDQYGMNSEAKGMIISLPVETIIGLRQFE